MRKDDLHDLLALVNRMRVAMGEQPINEIRKGKQEDERHCPLANSLGRVSVGGYGELLFERKKDMDAVQKVLGEDMEFFDGNSRSGYQVELHGEPGRLFGDFVEQFDGGNKRLTEAFKER